MLRGIRPAVPFVVLTLFGTTNCGPGALPVPADVLPDDSVGSVDAYGDDLSDVPDLPDNSDSGLGDATANAGDVGDSMPVADVPPVSDQSVGSAEVSDAAKSDIDPDGWSDTQPDIGIPCTASADCDDATACTDDMCVDGTCTHSPILSPCCDNGKPYFSANAESSVLAPLTTSSSLVGAAWLVTPSKYLNGKYEYFGGLTSLPAVPQCDPVSVTLVTPVLQLPATGQPNYLYFTLYAATLPPILTVHAHISGQTTLVWSADDPVKGLKPTQLQTKIQRAVDITSFQGKSLVLEFNLDLTPCVDPPFTGVFVDDICVD